MKYKNSSNFKKHIHFRHKSGQKMRRILLAQLLAFFTVFSYGDEPLRMVTGADKPLVLPNEKGFLQLVSKEAFKRIGKDITIQNLPPARAIQQVNRGQSDGDLLRIQGLETEFPNLVIVPEKISEYTFVAFTLKDKHTINGWDSFHSHKHSYLRGWKFYENNILTSSKSIVADSPKQLMNLLKRGRVDIILFSKWSGFWWGSKSDVKLKMIQPPLKSEDMFIYLNKKHVSIVAELARAIKNMKKDGSYQSIIKNTQHQFQ
jgi:polar amino acid transport system substrate-binding protein